MPLLKNNTFACDRCHVDATRKELQDLSVSYERLKNESNREVAKWKAKFVSAYEVRSCN